jgi:hypothetical protein
MRGAEKNYSIGSIEGRAPMITTIIPGGKTNCLTEKFSWRNTLNQAITYCFNKDPTKGVSDKNDGPIRLNKLRETSSGEQYRFTCHCPSFHP